MSEHDDEVYLDHIDRMAVLLGITKRIGRPRFDSEADVRDATIYRLQTLAESTQKLSAEFKRAHPDVPWDDIARFRNRAVHGYLGVDLDIIWDIVENDVEPLARSVDAELERRRSGRVQERGRERGPDLGLEP